MLLMPLRPWPGSQCSARLNARQVRRRPILLYCTLVGTLSRGQSRGTWSARHREALQENGGAPKPCQARQACAPGRDTPQSPFRGGLSGNGMLPVFFAASAAPSRGVWGTKLWPFFGIFFRRKKQSRNSDLASKNSQNAQKLATRGPGAAHVEVLDAEVRTLHIIQPNPPSQGQALNRSISNRAAKPRVL